MDDNSKFEPKENVDINQSFRSAWRKLNLSTDERSNTTAIDYYGNIQTFKETDEMMDISARAIDAISCKDTNIAFSTLTIPSTLQMFYGANQINKTSVFIPKSSINSDPSSLDEAEVDTIIVLDRFLPLVAESIAKTEIKNIILQSLTDDVDKAWFDDPVGKMKKLKSLDNPITRKIAEITRKDTLYRDIKEIRKSTLFKGKQFITLKEFREEGRNNRNRIEDKYIENLTSMLVYSSGTTGKPKGIEVTNEAMLGMYNMFNRQFEENDIFHPGDRFLNLVPIEHVTALAGSDVVAWLKGNTQVLMPFYNKETFAYQLRYWNIQNTMVAGNYYTPLIESGLPDGCLNHGSTYLSGGESIAFSLAKDLELLFEKTRVQKPNLNIGYGASEAGPSIINSTDRTGLVNQPGKPYCGIDVRVVDKHGNLVNDGQIGFLEAKTPNRMKGYYNSPELTEEAFTADGYYKSFDFGKRNENGTFDIVGRAKDGVKAYLKYYITNWDNGIYDTTITEESQNEVIAHIILRKNENPDISQDEYEKSIIKNLHERLLKENYDDFTIPNISYKVWTIFPADTESGKVDSDALSKATSEIYTLLDGEFVKNS